MSGQVSTPYWIETTPRTEFPPLQGDVSVDVVVVGGGITGITAAFLLKRAGLTVALVEARRIAEQVTGATTAKVTSLHGLIYADLAHAQGDEAAQLYGASQQAALELIASLVAERSIDCGFERKAAYTYSESEAKLDQLREEAETAARLGLPAAFVSEVPAPMPIAGAVSFANQAQFHPRRYLLDLARDIPGGGSHLFEQTRVQDVEDGEPCHVTTPQGTLSAREVIVATCLPILDRGAFFTTAYPRSHPVLAARIGEARAPDGMFLGIDQPGFSVRTHREGADLLAIITGPSYKAGHADPGELIRQTEEWAARHFDLQSVESRWTNHDYDSMDRMPFIGKLTSRSGHVWVGTGYSAWGMTGGTLAAMLLCELVQGRESPWAPLYDATRLSAGQGAGTFLRENVHVARMWLGDRLSSGQHRDVRSLGAGEGAVISTQDGKMAVSRDANGTLHAVSANCTHLGCTLAWNGVAQTWDCPCHGSRFEPDGRVISGPAVRPLERRELPSEASEKGAA